MEDWNWETIFYDHLTVYLRPLRYNGPEKSVEFGEKKRKIRTITAFKVIQGHRDRYQSPGCDFLLVINSNWHPISYRFEVIAAYCSNFEHIAFSSYPSGSLGTTYDVHLRLIGKHIVDFLLVLIELSFAMCYGWVATSKKRSQIGDYTPTRSAWYKIKGRRGRNHQSF